MLNQKIKDFADQRDWDQFHSPKNLSMALSAEVGELLEIFLWLKEEEPQNRSFNTLRKVEEERGCRRAEHTVMRCDEKGEARREK